MAATWVTMMVLLTMLSVPGMGEILLACLVPQDGAVPVRLRETGKFAAFLATQATTQLAVGRVGIVEADGLNCLSPVGRMVKQLTIRT